MNLITNCIGIFLSRKIDLESVSLIYHSVEADNSNPLVSNNIHNVSPEKFYSQLAQLKKKYHVIPIDELTDRLANGKSVKGLASVTFDDGYRSVVQNALPVLTDLNIPATLFLTTSLVEKKHFWRDKVRYIINKELVKQFLVFAAKERPDFPKLDPERFYKQSKDASIVNSKNTDELIDLFLASIEVNLDSYQQDLYLHADEILPYKYLQFGNHTLNHYILSGLSEDEQYREIAGGELYLKDKGLTISRNFSIPFGGKGTYDKKTLQIILDLGYKGVLLSSAYRPFGVRNIRDWEFDLNLIPIMRFMPRDENTIQFE